ncbi:YchJ family protein [Microbacterium lacticum]
MSFGAAAQRGSRPASDAPCPCGAVRFAWCCGPILGGRPADTAEELMRSRYTAFALGDAVHLRATWHPTTAPAHLDLDPARRWDGLEVLRTSGGGPGDRVGTVEFRARWYQASTRVRGELRENSRFRRVAGRWYYIDGDVR